MKKCPKCGTLCPDGNLFCNGCGAKFEVVAEPEPTVQPAVNAESKPAQENIPEGKKQCPNCGKYISKENSFCTFCGTRFSVVVEAATEPNPVPKPEPKVEPKPEPAPAPVPEPVGASEAKQIKPAKTPKKVDKKPEKIPKQKPEKHTSRVLPIILIVIFSLLAVGALGFFVWSGLERYGIINDAEGKHPTNSVTDDRGDEPDDNPGQTVGSVPTMSGSDTTPMPDFDPASTVTQAPADTPAVTNAPDVTPAATQPPTSTPAVTEAPLYDVYFTDEYNRRMSGVTVFSGDVIHVRNLLYYNDSAREAMSKSSYRLSWDVEPASVVNVEEATAGGICDIVALNPGTCEIRPLVWIDGKVAYYGEPIKVMVEAAPVTPTPTPDPYNVYAVLNGDAEKKKITEYTLAAGTPCDFDFVGVGKWSTGEYEAVWTSEDENVATVDASKGLVTGWHSGTVLIRLTIKNKNTGDTSEYTVAPLVITVYGDATPTPTPTVKPATPTPSPKPLTLWLKTDTTRSTNITKDGLKLTAGGSSVELTFDGQFDDYSKIKDKYTFKWRIYDLDGNESSKYATVKLKGSGSNNAIITPKNSECNKKCYVILKIYDTSGRKVYESKKVYLIIKKMK
ncbi:MAG: zinc ribbon domain-containing protein [Lachnospiraceae bacterium]|nr:zinc ribbon domain-containing protein [Lachnospiraceae bacterium]